MIDQLNIDRRAMLAGLSALALPSAVLAAPRDYPSTLAFLDEYVGGGRLANCVVAVARKGRRVEYFSRGPLALDTNIPAGPDSLFRIYSMTKPVTGIAFLTLVERGVLRLDQPLADILPEFANPTVILDGDLEKTRPAAGPILMRHLITHTSGLSYSINGAAPLARAYTRYGLAAGGRSVAAGLVNETDLFPPARDLETFGRRLALLPLDFDPGTRWQYSVGLDLMGLVIQRAAGMPFTDYLKETIFGPLAMVDTDFVAPRSKQNRLTSVYTGAGGTLRVNDDRANSRYMMDRDMPTGGAGLVSTAQDYVKFCQMLLNDGALGRTRILRPESVRIARSNLMDPAVSTAGTFAGAGNGFGAAVQVLGAASAAGEGQGTYGWDGAAGTTMWIDPVKEVAVVGMVQIQGGANIHNPLRQAIYQDISSRR